ncbi:M43 family zinc metalloprotease [Leptospira levettii]|uniref:M43 family zinc metalloprotease n=1 Tax=Leptospira levettii TaxID=2023178 RepID=A0AAW5VGQ9_9LEPT|nr:M43 family zinc metalloprotease [Leptospira levettii]MCW7467689.1 M43 family zinc metalloprotease [Leptospira levettii]MCW7513405.1 M43 family zinc metalloprotease [Leptospira levettii]MCW7517092.1 M43 family zinc metalloprotease [Leptospira levettii]
MRKYKILILFSILLFLSHCVKKKADSGIPDNVLTVLLVNSLLNSGTGPCTTTDSIQPIPIGAWSPNGDIFQYSSIYPVTLNKTRPMVQVVLENLDAIPGGLFPLWYLDRNNPSTGFLNKDVATYIGFNTHTSMLPYAKDTSYATSPAVSISNTVDTSQPLGVDFNFENPAGAKVTFVNSCRKLEIDESNFQTSTALSSTSGLNHFWNSEKKLNVNLIFVNGGNGPAYPIQTEQAIEVALNRWKENYAKSSVRIKLNVSVISADLSGYDMIFDLGTETGFPGSLGGLFQTTSFVGKPNALNVFIVREEIQYGGVLGVSGGIPGPATILGTKQSGIVVFVDAHRLYSNPGEVMTYDEQVLLGETLSHEAGHFLGLWHVTEAYGDSGSIADRDPLRDTPTCHISNDINFNGIIDLNECLGGSGTNSGGRNMMFWSGAVGFTQGEITAEQGWILRLNPLVY